MSLNNRSARIEARITPDSLAIVKRAAELEGRSVSDFVVAAAQEAAARAIERRRVIKLTLQEQERVFEALMKPQKPKGALKRAFAAHRRLIKSSE